MLTAPAAAASTNLLTQTNLIDGTEIGVWETDGGPALTNSTVTGKVTDTKTPMIRWGAYDCFTDATCGSNNHTGSLSKTTFENTISGIVNTLHAIPWLKLVPMARGSIGSVTDGTVFCPPGDGSNWGMNLAMYKKELDAVAAVYKGPIIVESSNEAEYDCWQKWGFTGAGVAGVSTDIGKMWSATMPALKAYARSLGFSQVVTVGYIGINGGLNWGQTCTANSNYPFGYQCTAANRWIDEFNSQVHTDYVANGNNSDYIPDVESVHSYCHSADNASNPFSFDDNKCYALQREWIINSRTQVNNYWGSTIGNNIRFAVSEWQAGVCTNTTSNCWSGFGTSAVGTYDDGWLSMLAGNGSTTGSGTAYWAANLFEIASNNSGPTANYNIVNSDGTTPSWYANIKSDFLASQGAHPCSISLDSSTPAVAHSSPYGSSSVSTASFTPPAGSLLEVLVTTLQGSQPGGAAVSVSDSASDTYTVGPSVEGSLTPEGVWLYRTYLPSSPGAITATATQTAGHVGSIQLAVRVQDNVSQVQSGAASGSLDYTGSPGTVAYSSLTTTQAGSWVVVGAANGDSAHSSYTPLSTTSNADLWYDPLSGDLGAIGQSASATGSPGATNFGWTNGVNDHYVWAAQEILPAAC